MEAYLERLCVFICLGDLLCHFLPSQKFAKLYRFTVGALILLLIIRPLGQEISELTEKGKGETWESFEERILTQNAYWDVRSEENIRKESERITDAYLGQMEDEEMKEALSEYGYKIDDEILIEDDVPKDDAVDGLEKYEEND